MLIDGRQQKKLRILEFFITCMGWIYVGGFIFHTLLSLVLWYFNLSNIYFELFVPENVSDTLKVLVITFLTGILSLCLMFLWRKYNLKRFGGLHRRKFKEFVTAEDISQYFNLPVEEIYELQNSKWVDMDETIV